MPVSREGFRRRARPGPILFKPLDECVMSRYFDRQVAELQIRAAILNRFTALGTLLTAQDRSVQGKGHSNRQRISATKPQQGENRFAVELSQLVTTNMLGRSCHLIDAM